mgnify:CR=1 FL=1
MAIGPYELTATELSASISADRLGLPYLLFRGDDGELVIRTLEDQVLVVGRSPDADLPLVWDGEVSRVHAQLERIAGRWTVSDDGLSRNGTFIGPDRVNGRRVLAHGDVIRAGQTSLVYRAPSEGLDEVGDLTGIDRTVVRKGRLRNGPLGRRLLGGRAGNRETNADGGGRRKDQHD